MSKAYKPQAYPSVSVYMVAKDAPGLIRFMQTVFGGEITRKYEMPDGSIMHAEVRIDDTIVMLGESGGPWIPVSNWLHVYVPDVDDVYRRALDAGAVSVKEPQAMEGDPDKRGGVRDAWGNTWWIATQQA